MEEPMLINSRFHNPDSGGSMFREARDVHIHGGTFNAYGSGGTDDKKRIADAMALLSSRAEQGASYDTAAREDVPKCHERTRLAITDGIHKWAHSLQPNARPLMWMYGPAGSGKTTIMQTVAEIFDKEGSLAASFFFSRLSAARPRNKEKFVITLAHQLSCCIPALRQPLADALSDFAILSKSLVRQLDSLVIGPLNGLEIDQTRHHYIFLVDGLDECAGDTAQRDVLNLLERLLHQSRYRVRILVASRSLPLIQSYFSQGSIGEITQTTPLDTNYQTDEDIAQFLNSEFTKIRAEHPSRVGVPSEWPSRRDIKILVARASGQFIYASVVMKFIADHGRHPAESLQTIIGLNAGSHERPYEELDAVYTQVLSTIAPQNTEFVQAFMGCLVLDPERFYFAHVPQAINNTIMIDSVFMTQPGTTEARISRLYPLIKTRNIRRGSYRIGFEFSHASFPEYLLDYSRSKHFFLDMQMVHCTLARCWFKLFAAHFKLRPDGIPRNVASYRPPAMFSFGGGAAVMVNMINHCVQSKWTSELRQDVLDFDIKAAFLARAEQIQRGDAHILWDGILFWLELIFWIKEKCLLSSPEVERILDRVHDMIQSVLSEQPPWPTFRRGLSALLTLRKHEEIKSGWADIPRAFNTDCTRGWERIYQPDDLLIFHEHIRDASYSWLCRILAGGVEMNGSFLADGTVYTDLALLYSQVHEWHAER
ncbi:hypothetical protein D9619_013718 [Psilocybe cf. subviscida]|uniref:NACHT domain-containing protein n=1 Tax=Psilocybe cf. subviscida TaxID=2480587 RepID=A0A8H5AZC6_9AGAR|nr:hypothetical protein D9619_013718 [Psilocybe cf. subviscida]